MQNLPPLHELIITVRGYHRHNTAVIDKRRSRSKIDYYVEAAEQVEDAEVGLLQVCTYLVDGFHQHELGSGGFGGLETEADKESAEAHESHSRWAVSGNWVGTGVGGVGRILILYPAHV